MLKGGNFDKLPPEMQWTPGNAMSFMDAHGIQLQLLSFPMPLAVDAARGLNDFGASVVTKHPGRFGLLASLPLADPAAAVEEIGRALDELHADGFILVTKL